MSIIIKILLIFIFNIFILHQSFALNLDLTFHKETINDYCDFLYNKKDNLFSSDHWRVEEVNNIKEYFHLSSKIKIKIFPFIRGEKINGIRFTFYNESQEPLLLVNVDKKCNIIVSRLIQRDINGKIFSIDNLSSDLSKVKSSEYFNPPLKKQKPFKGIKVAIVDTGVNYNLDFIADKISRIDESNLTGYDFEDNDSLPYDIDTGRSVFFPMHHGTSVSSIILREAPMSELVVYRFPRSEMCKFENLIEHISVNKIKIVNLSMGSVNKDDWQCFYKAAKSNKNILFFVSAGNDGKNIDFEKIYPASFDLENIIVVTSSDISGNLAQGSNFGSVSVDFLIPGEQIPVIDHRGVKTNASGSSFAVPRVVAMAIRILSNNTNANILDIKSKLISRAIRSNEKVKYGWIPDPLDNYLLN
ncbi:S8 family serine peptidase [SAR116 cluster bacterium]|nr:S8 family serine peptidase [SAR116 cluster bacterium]